MMREPTATPEPDALAVPVPCLFPFPPDGVNLDAMPVRELDTFIDLIGWGVRPVAMARRLFPACPAGFCKATLLLRGYADNKRVAMASRAIGNIETAVLYETICDSIYARLPDYARFW